MIDPSIRNCDTDIGKRYKPMNLKLIFSKDMPEKDVQTVIEAARKIAERNNYPHLAFIESNGGSDFSAEREFRVFSD